MQIDKIIISDFRVYQGLNELTFSVKPAQNVSIISGNNGFGKTSFLTSLVWCMYGKLMGDVDERYRREIYESGGYKKYCQKILNLRAAPEQTSFFVSIRLSKLQIPSLPCEYVQLTRTYHTATHQEEMEIMIDGQRNELTKDVGPDIFINDFILPKEIAKFFFFDAEKIVSLAEMRTTEEKRQLSRAYAEVLGIKKYLDLKDNLENLRVRLRKTLSDKNESDRREMLRKQAEQQDKLIILTTERVAEKSEELMLKKVTSDKLQERLIREGTSLTVEDLKDYRQMKEHLGEETAKIRHTFKDLVELAPFAMAANKLILVKKQVEIERENANKATSVAFLTKRIKDVRKSLKQNRRQFGLDAADETKLMKLIETALLNDKTQPHKVLLEFSPEQENRFLTICDNIAGSYNDTFRELVANYKKNQSAYLMIIRKLQDGESKENDPVIKTIRADKTKVDSDIAALEYELIDLQAKKLALQNEYNGWQRQISELDKKAEIEATDKAKDAVAARLIGELEEFIYKLKVKKKSSLEHNILMELNKLMHKTSFIKKVEVIIEGEIIEIDLFDRNGKVIDKEGLSKGEQQLYATALLRALVRESNILFPVFIDSPLQKFDKTHARNIIKDFYPTISSQVILFPLLDKELSEEEYNWLLPKVGCAYLIENSNDYASRFVSVPPKELFTVYHSQDTYVHHN